MNIIRARQEERKMKIRELIETLKKARKEGVDIDERKLVAECCMRWGMAMRSVKEYLEIARHQI